MIYFGAVDSHTLLTSGVAGHLPKPQTGPPCMNSCCRAQDQHRRGIYLKKKKKGQSDGMRQDGWHSWRSLRKPSGGCCRDLVTKIRPRTPWFIFMLSASPVGLTAWCAETPVEGNSSTVHLLFTEINFEHPSQNEWGCSLLAEKCWAFMQS